MITKREQMIDPHLMKVGGCVCLCAGVWQNACNCTVCVRSCAHMCLHVHMCGQVQRQAVYSTDIISMSTQRWVVLISFPSMPFKQHGNHSGEWIWNKARMHWCGDCNFCLWIQEHTHTQYSTLIQTLLSHWCFNPMGEVSFYVRR